MTQPKVSKILFMGNEMNRQEALQYVGYCLDDALSPDHTIKEMPSNAVLVGWQCGFEPMFVAVWSYLPNTKLDAESAVEIATDYLHAIGWFGVWPYNSIREPDYVIT